MYRHIIKIDMLPVIENVTDRSGSTRLFNWSSWSTVGRQLANHQETSTNRINSICTTDAHSVFLEKVYET